MDEANLQALALEPPVQPHNTLRLVQRGGATATRYAFVDEASSGGTVRVAGDDAVVRTCAAHGGVGLFARRACEAGRVVLSATPVAHAARRAGPECRGAFKMNATAPSTRCTFFNAQRGAGVFLIISVGEIRG